MSKKWVFKLLTAFITVSFVIMTINYIVDPFQQYRIATWYKVTDKKQRNVIPGLAKNIAVETVIIGSSMVENFRVSFINKEQHTYDII